MENAQKAIMIGVGLFITIIIIAAVMLITGMGQNLLNQGQSQIEGISESLMNDLIAQYDGKVMSGAQVRTAAVQLVNRSDANITVKIGDTTVNKDTASKENTINNAVKNNTSSKYEGSVSNSGGSVTVTFTKK